jgi:hypothetical protein
MNPLEFQPGSSDIGDACVLISETCTTGWFDWAHGELWLCTNGLLRRSVGLWTTTRRYFNNGRPRAPSHNLTVTTEERNRITAADPRNRWVGWADIGKVTLKAGIIDHSLHFELIDGRRVKFLWIGQDGDFELLEKALGAAVGDRLIIHQAPIG